MLMNRMLRMGLMLLMACGALRGQSDRAHIENFSVTPKEKQVLITYDLQGEIPDLPHQIDLIVIDNVGNIVIPDSVEGDLGPAILPGNDKQIIWNLYREFDVVHGDFLPQIILDGHQKYGFKGGPENLLLSVLVPGLGDYFVADQKTMKIKPYYKTAFTLGMLGLAWAAKTGREEIPAVIAPPGWYWYDYDGVFADWVYVDHSFIKVEARTDYWLFRYDSEVFLGIGLAAWITDVIWVARRGTRNNRIRSDLMNHLSLAPVPKGFMFTFAYSF